MVEHEFAHADEGSHDRDVYLDGPFAGEYRGEHRYALFRECQGE
jgi:hypothetical protein